MARYDYGFEYRPGDAYGTWYPGAFWAAPMAGWAGWGGAGIWGWPPYAPVGYGRYPRPYPPRRSPRESPTYGRGGDQAVRRYARSHGYGAGYPIRPHSERGVPPYERDYRGRW